MLRALFREIVLIDNDPALAAAEAADLSNAKLWHVRQRYRQATMPMRPPQIAVITAGAATYGDEDRLAVVGKNAAIVRACVNDLMAAGFDGVLLVASNPVDLMTLVALKKSGLPAKRVIGTGTLLDSNRLQQ